MVLAHAQPQPGGMPWLQRHRGQGLTIGPGLSAKARSKALMCLNSNMFRWTKVLRIFWLVQVMKSL